MTGNDQSERQLRVYHYTPVDFADRFALGSVKFLRFLANSFFQRRYGHRAVILETVAAVPGMVGGALTHLKSLRRFEDDRGWIKTLLDEAQNERAHLMTFYPSGDAQLVRALSGHRCAGRVLQPVFLYVPVLAACRPPLRRLPRGGGDHQLHGVPGRASTRERSRMCRRPDMQSTIGSLRPKRGYARSSWP